MESIKTTRTTRMIYVEEISDTEKSSSHITSPHSDFGSHSNSRKSSTRSCQSTPKRRPTGNGNQNRTHLNSSWENFFENSLSRMSDYQNLIDNSLNLTDTQENQQSRDASTTETPRPSSALPETKDDPFLISKSLAQQRPLTPHMPCNTQDMTSQSNGDVTIAENNSANNGENPIFMTTDSDIIAGVFSTTDTEVNDVIMETANEEAKNQEKNMEADTTTKTPSDTPLNAVDMVTISEKMASRKLNRRTTGMGPRALGRGTSKVDVLRNVARAPAKFNKTMQQMDDMRTMEDSLMYQTLKPLLTCMKFSGIFFVKKKGTYGKSFTGWLRSMSPLQTYCLLTNIVLCANFLRTIPIFDGSESFDSMMFFKLLALIFAYEAMSRAMLNYTGCAMSKKGYQHIFLSLDNVCYSDGIVPYERQMKKVMNFMIIASIVISLLNVGMTAVGMYVDNAMFDVLLAPVPYNIQGIIYFKIFQLGMMFINAYIAMFSLSFFTAICYGLYKEFEYFTRTFSMKIREDGTFTEDMEKFRIMHQKRCKLVEDSDQSFKYYIANTYATNVPLLCLLLYSLVYDESNSISFRFINTFRILYVFLQMMVVSIAATLINTQAHAPLAYVYSIKVQKASAERQLEMSMFLNKLTGTSIGLTAWDMFVINKPAILTVIGMILTYFFLIVQVKNPMLGSSGCSCQVNSSLLATADTYWKNSSLLSSVYDMLSSTVSDTYWQNYTSNTTLV